MGITTEGAARIAEIQTDALQFVVSHVVYGSGGYDLDAPATPLPLNPAATALTTELYRKPVPPQNTVKNQIYFPRGKETTYTSVGGVEFTGIVGEAGLIATVTDPGTTGLSTGYQFLLAQAHFGRVVFSTFDRLALVFPIAYFANPVESVSYDESGMTYDETGIDYSGY